MEGKATLEEKEAEHSQLRHEESGDEEQRGAPGPQADREREVREHPGVPFKLKHSRKTDMQDLSMPF